MSHTQEPKTVLVVDDMPDILKVLKKHLEHWGYRPVLASSGEEALAMAAANHPDLILLDILMPAMKGREVCARLKADPATKHIPVIFLTALGLADHVKAGLELGADDYVIKPFKAADLRERIKVCLLRAASHAQRQTTHSAGG